MVAQVGDRPDGPRQILRIRNRKTMPRNDRHDGSLRQCAVAVADIVKRARRGGLDGLEVVAPLTHGPAQHGVRHPGLLRRGRRPGALPAQFRVQRDDVLEHVAGHPGAGLHVGQSEIPVHGVALRLFHRDLQLRPAARRLVPEKFLGRHGQRGGQRLDQRQLGLPAAVLQQRERRGSTPHSLAQLGERDALSPAQMPQTLPECCKV